MTYTRHIAAFLLPAALLLTACGESGPEQVTGPLSGSEATLPARDAGDLEGGDGVRGPEKAEQGTWYPHDFFSHCGLHGTEFAGRSWVLRTLRTDLESPVEGGGEAEGQNVLAGYIQLESPDVAVFVSSELPPVELRPGKPTFACK
ncbi:hypothetical protein [Streptomyces indicus]|uniref:Uncharacterized protein n=1 Tax=Streptomyces indicus TaxID=417292 RepID=A0A1G8ZXB5_9ACTN|nr:hypothetical protein [Streptomyces indicus]SDK18760.1 hypothetical protein SAMN05421806_105202 [Streptomyces indicus]